MVRGWYSELLKVLDAELRWLRDLRSGGRGYVARVYYLTEFDFISSTYSSDRIGFQDATHFCLKYNKPLRRTAIPEEARTGSRSHPRVLDKYWFMLSMLKLR